jgi:hypothetical protein
LTRRSSSIDDVPVTPVGALPSARRALSNKPTGVTGTSSIGERRCPQEPLDCFRPLGPEVQSPDPKKSKSPRSARGVPLPNGPFFSPNRRRLDQGFRAFLDRNSAGNPMRAFILGSFYCLEAQFLKKHRKAPRGTLFRQFTRHLANNIVCLTARLPRLESSGLWCPKKHHM